MHSIKEIHLYLWVIDIISFTSDYMVTWKGLLPNFITVVKTGWEVQSSQDDVGRK